MSVLYITAPPTVALSPSPLQRCLESVTLVSVLLQGKRWSHKNTDSISLQQTHNIFWCLSKVGANELLPCWDLNAHTHACTQTHMHTHSHTHTHIHSRYISPGMECSHTHTHTHSYIHTVAYKRCNTSNWQWWNYYGEQSLITSYLNEQCKCLFHFYTVQP